MIDRLNRLWKAASGKIPSADKKQISLSGVFFNELPDTTALADNFLGYIRLDPLKLEPLSDVAIMAVIAHELGHLYHQHTDPYTDCTYEQVEKIADDHARHWGFDVEALFREVRARSVDRSAERSAFA